MEQAEQIKLLSEEVKKGNQAAFTKIYSLLWEKLYKRAFVIIKDKEAVQDIVQEIFVKYWTKLRHEQIENIEAYLTQATRMATYRYIQKNKMTLEIDDFILALPSISEIENKYNFEELSEIIEEILKNHISERSAQIFRMSKLEGYSNEEIAETLQISKRTVENKISSSLKIVKDNLVIWFIIQQMI